jgi:hypothetical protein
LQVCPAAQIVVGELLQLGKHTPKGAVMLLTVRGSQTYPTRQLLCPAPGEVQFPTQKFPPKRLKQEPLKHRLLASQEGLQYPPGKMASMMQLSTSPVPVPSPVRQPWSLVQAAPGPPLPVVQALLLQNELMRQPWHNVPPKPQALLEVPGEQPNCGSQQPLAQVVALHADEAWQEPLRHVWPSGHTAHVEPLMPHATTLVF